MAPRRYGEASQAGSEVVDGQNEQVLGMTSAML